MLDGMWEDIKRSWTSGSMLYRLIWVNVVVFVLVNAALIMTKLGGLELSVGIRDCFGLKIIFGKYECWKIINKTTATISFL